MNKQICPKNCPNRCALPNCHNAATCERWAAHEAEAAQKRREREKTRGEIDDFWQARGAHRKKSCRHYAREKKVRR